MSLSITPVISLNLKFTYFSLVCAGMKTVEGRLKKPNLSMLKMNDIIRFTPEPAPSKNEKNPYFVDVKVVHLNSYPTFREMLQKEGVHHCFPGVTNLEEGVKIYHSFPSYQELEKKLGVLAIGIELCNKRTIR